MIGIAVFGAMPAHAATAAPTVHIEDGGDAYINASEAGAVMLSGTYDASDPNIVSIQVSVPATSGACSPSGTTAATLNPLDSTFTAGPFDLTSDIDYTQSLALCATAQAIGVTPADDSLVSVSDNSPIKDTIAPAAAAALTVPDPINAANVGALDVTVDGGEDGATANISLDDTDAGTAPANAAAIIAGSTVVIVDATGLTDGTVTGSVTQTDPAGNTGAATSALAVTKNALPPVGTVEMIDDNGFLTSAEVTAGSIPANWASTATDVVSTSVFFTDASGNLLAPATNCGPFAVGQSGNGGLNSTCAQALPEGVFYFKATWTDTAGNTFTAATSLIKDTVAPAAGDLVVTAPTDGASFPAGSAVAAAGSAPSGSAITVVEDNGRPRTVTSDASGTWSLALGAQTEGAHYLVVRIADAAGNVGPTAELRFTMSPPVVPDALIPAITGPSADVLPAVFVLTGTGKPTSRIDIFEGSTSLGRTTVDSAGNWSKDIAIGDGAHQLTARGTAANGRVSDPAPAFSVLVDAGRPGVTLTPPTSTLPSQAGITVFGPANALSFKGKATDTGPLDHFGVAHVNVSFVNALTGVAVLQKDACTNCALNAASADWSITPALGPGYYDVIVTSLDFAGNRSATAATEIIVL